MRKDTGTNKSVKKEKKKKEKIEEEEKWNKEWIKESKFNLKMLLTVDFKTKNDVNSTSLCKFIVEQGILRALTNNTTLILIAEIRDIFLRRIFYLQGIFHVYLGIHCSLQSVLYLYYFMCTCQYQVWLLILANMAKIK